MQLLLPNSIVDVCFQQNQSSRWRAGWSLSARDLCCPTTPSTYSNNGSSLIFSVPTPLCARDGLSSMCWLVLCRLMALLLSHVSSLGTKKTQTLQWPLVSGSTTGVEQKEKNLCTELRQNLPGHHKKNSGLGLTHNCPDEGQYWTVMTCPQ